MKRRDVLMDTGPLIAIVSRHDMNHRACIAELTTLQAPLLTCWPVLTEAFWLLRANSAALRGIFRGFADKLWTLAPIGPEAFPWLEGFLMRYHKVGAQLADAALVYLAERDGIETVFTLDRRDFSIYRYRKNQRLKIVPAE